MYIMKKIIQGIVILFVIAVIRYAYTQSTPEQMQSWSNEIQIDEVEQNVVSEDDVSMQTQEDKDNSEKSYEVYTDTSIDSALQDNKKVVLFFHAKRCPSCRSLDKEISENIAAIPSQVKIIKIDYDTYADLKKKYAVRTQHTIIVLDPKGAIEQTLVGSDLQDLQNIR